MKIFLTLLFFISLLSSCGDNAKQNRRPFTRHPQMQMLPIPAGLGVNIHFYEGDEKDWAMLQKAGVGIVRMDVSWAGLEKSPGEYDFSRHDKLVAELEKRNMRLLFILDYGNPLYDDGLAPHTPQGRDAWARLASALATRYREKNVIWELWNEPNLDKFWKPKANAQDYMAWCKAVAPAIRKADPDACIIGPAVNQAGMDFLSQCFDLGLLDLVDGVSVHPYRGADLGPETALDDYNDIAAAMRLYAPDKELPILSGEWGYNTTVMTPALQGKYLARQWLSNVADGLPISIWYDWHDDGQDPNEGEHNFGTVLWDYRRKPAYIAMKTLIHQLDGFLPLARIRGDSENDFLTLFFKEDSVKLAAWNTGAAHRLELPDVTIDAAVDHLGAAWHAGKLTLSDAPLYLSLTPPWAEWLQLLLDAASLDAAARAVLAQEILDKSTDGFAGRLRRALESDVDRERESALHVLEQCADAADRKTALSLYHLVLRENAFLPDKRRAMYGVIALGDDASLPVVGSIENDPALSETAAATYWRMAIELADKGTAQKASDLFFRAAKLSHGRMGMRTLLEKLRADGVIRETDRDIAGRLGFIADWWIAGPFPNENDAAEKTAFFPEQEIDASLTQISDDTTRWRKIKTNDLHGVISFADMFGRVPGAAYAYTEIEATKDGPALLKIGSNDGVVVWVNGEQVHKNFAARSLRIDDDIVPVTLKKGANRILIKVLNKGANWEACVRVCDENGMPMDMRGD